MTERNQAEQSIELRGQKSIVFAWHGDDLYIDRIAFFVRGRP